MIDHDTDASFVPLNGRQLAAPRSRDRHGRARPGPGSSARGPVRGRLMAYSQELRRQTLRVRRSPPHAQPGSQVAAVRL
jgi:hypothetical protein